MDRDQCWSMIETARQASGGDVQQQAAVLRAELRRLPPAEVIGFQQNLEDLQAESFSVELWGPPRPSSTRSPRTTSSDFGDG